MNEKEKNNAKKAAAPKRTYRRRTSPKEKPAKDTAVKAEAAAAKPRTRTRQPKEVKKTPVKIIPLGGLNEIGKNMTVFECSNDMFILDCGLAFPDADMPGVDIVIPDFT